MVVGGGIAGLSAAGGLRRRGRRVTLVALGALIGDGATAAIAGERDAATLPAGAAGQVVLAA
jgi:glycine/D-amino acid oxidase-like deaminating enzyme